MNYDFTPLSCILLLFLLRHIDYYFFLRIINTVFKNIHVCVCETFGKRLRKMRDCSAVKYYWHCGKISIFDGVIAAASCRGNHSRRVGGATVLYTPQGRGHLYPKWSNDAQRQRTGRIWGPKRSRDVALITAQDIEPLIVEGALERGRASHWPSLLAKSFVRSFVRSGPHPLCLCR